MHEDGSYFHWRNSSNMKTLVLLRVAVLRFISLGTSSNHYVVNSKICGVVAMDISDYCCDRQVYLHRLYLFYFYICSLVIEFVS